MSQTELGEALGFTSRIQIGKYERGEAPIPRYIELAVRYLLIKRENPELPEAF